MKEKDLQVNCPYQQVILYAEKGDGTFGPMQTGSFMAGTHISEHFKIAGNQSRILLEQLRNNEICPLYYFMKAEGLTVAELAGRTAISKMRVRKHLTVKGFQKMRISSLKKYAHILNIPVANMFQIISTVEDRNWDIGYEGDLDKSKTGSISQKKTKNPLIIETNVIRDQK